MGDQNQIMDLRHLLNTLYNGKWVILAAVILTMAIAAVSNYFQDLKYQSYVQIQIDAPPFLPNQNADLVSQSNYYTNVEKYFRTQQEKLLSRRLRRVFAERIIKQDARYRNRSAELLIADFGNDLRVEPVEDTNLVTVYFSADNPDKAAEWLNIFADIFVEENARQQEENVKQNREFLRAQLNEIKNMLNTQQEQVNSHVSAAGGKTSADSVSDTDFLFRYQSAYDDARNKRMEEEQKLNKLEPYLSQSAILSNIPSFDFTSGLRTYFDKLSEANAAIEKLRLEGKGEEHPAVTAQKIDLQHWDEVIRAELKKSADSLRLNISSLKSAEQSALEVYNRKMAERKASSRQLQEVAKLEQAGESWTKASALVEDKLRSLKVIESFVTNNVSVVERAVANPRPISKRGLGFILIAGIGGIILGSGILIAGELMNPKVKTVEEIPASFDIPALGFLPRSKDFSLNEIRESYNVLRTEILFRREVHSHRCFMITSSIPQEGKTTVTYNLAKTLAAAGDRTVVLDFDLRKARIRSLLKGESSFNGNRVFSPVEGLNLRLETSDCSTLHFIVPVTLPQNPPFLLSQPEIRELLEYLRKRYDWVLIDTPPIGSVTDPIIIASMVDAVLFVIKHNFVDKRIVKNSIAALVKVNANPMGAVLNDLDLKKMSYYAYQNYYRYYSDSDIK
jgi:capsular exopolysaccharide synthesis family protein